MGPLRSSCLLALALVSLVVLGATAALAADGDGPATFQVGNAQVHLGGSLDLAGIYRGSNTGNSVTTSFGRIPYENTVQGNIAEWRMTAQMSRLNLKVTDQFGRTAVTGFAELDFAGNAPADQFVNFNSHTFRLTHLWLGVQRGSWGVLAGQTWSWVTPGFRGLDAGSEFLTRNLDLGLQVGLPWTRAAQIRAAYRAGGHFAAGLALENPQQYIGAGEVIFPFAYNAQLGTQVDAGANPGTPNSMPDILGKLAFDFGSDDFGLHLEGVGLARRFHVTVVPVGVSRFDDVTTSGTAGGVTVGITARRNARLIASGFHGDGVGRYLGALGPDFVVEVGPTLNRASLNTVHAQSFLFGAELDLPGSNGLAAYYGRVDFDRTTFLDISNPVPNRWGGFGGVNSPNSANRTLHQLSVDVSHKFWDSPEHGSFAVLAQFSEVFRQPWFAATNAPNRALVDMVYFDVRYTLP